MSACSNSDGTSSPRATPPVKRPIIEDETNQDVGSPHTTSSKVDDNKLAYNFLLQLTVPDLRKIAKLYKVKQTMKKTSMVQSVFLNLMGENSKGNSWDSLINTVYEEEYADYKIESKDLIRRGCFLDVPDPAFLKEVTKAKTHGAQYSKVLGKRKDDIEAVVTTRPAKKATLKGGGSNSVQDLDEAEVYLSYDGTVPQKKKGMTLSEFSRLLYILRDEEAVCDAWKKSKQPLSKSDLTQRKKPGDFWKQHVEPSYNDPFVLPVENFPQYIDEEIDLSFSGDERTASQLSNCLERFQKGFNLILNNYRRSGQNNASFEQFLRTNGSDFMAMKTKMLLVAAFAFGVGTENENVRLLSLMTRTADEDGFAGRESGLGNYDWKGGEGSDISRRNSGRSRRTSKDSAASGDKLEKLLETIADRVQSSNTEKDSSTKSKSIDADSIEKKERVLNAYKRCISNVSKDKVDQAEIELQQQWDKYLQEIQDSLNAGESKSAK